jgi:hypothetical protein
MGPAQMIARTVNAQMERKTWRVEGYALLILACPNFGTECPLGTCAWSIPSIARLRMVHRQGLLLVKKLARKLAALESLEGILCTR